MAAQYTTKNFFDGIRVTIFVPKTDFESHVLSLINK